MDFKELPPLDLLRQLLKYDSELGKLYWLPRTPDMFVDGIHQSKEVKCNVYNKRHAGKEAGTIRYNYLFISIDHQCYAMSRICYALYHDEQLSIEVDIDHINRISTDNRIKNLRKATRSQNVFNTRIKSRNTSGHIGVSRIGPRTWRAGICVNGKRIHLGCYEKIEEALEARRIAEKQYYPDFDRHAG